MIADGASGPSLAGALRHGFLTRIARCFVSRDGGKLDGYNNRLSLNV